jgi:hypothetical protein
LLLGVWICKNDALSDKLRKWTANYNVSQVALKSIVKIINRHLHQNLPVDPRTIMRTPRSVDIIKLGTEDSYWHQGLRICLKNCFKYLEENISISLNINIDGLPLHNSTNRSAWPILFNVQEFPGIKPMAIGILIGESKPENGNQFLQHFVDEIAPILTNGIRINGHVVQVRIRAFICDSPARALVKGTANFNAKDGCQKCCVNGKYSYDSNTVVFTKLGQPRRTDQMFRENQYPTHVTRETPLTALPIDMIKDFVVADPLHLLELGVMKRLLIGWKTGNLGYNTKWNIQEKDKISQFLLQIKMPSEIHRDARSLKHFSNWKGLEFRNFLNYYGVVVLRKHLPDQYYKHFLKLFGAVIICSVKKHLRHLDVARVLFEGFITDYKRIYGPEFITSNVHNLEHIVDDVTRFGVLFSISTYPFENNLYSIKRLLKTGSHPLVQIVNRLTERLYISDFNYKHEIGQSAPVISKNGGEVTMSNYKLSALKFKDMWFLANAKIMCMSKAFTQREEIFVTGYSINEHNDLFDLPFKSSILDIYIANVVNVRQECSLISVNVKDITCKFVAIEDEGGKCVFIPLQHTIKE